ncbi:MAG TPA: hypothetical protein P5299_02395 [Candidatus Woesebacteria bacterium]|nr:hypothetical protein [Candidatus Woesebacteria bacterium]
MTPLFQEAKQYLSTDQINLIEDVELILTKLQKFDHINDYSFLVAPAAKAYEGYLKDFFLKIGLMSPTEYKSDRYRVGKTLNPSLRYRKLSVYRKLADIREQGEELAEILWSAWKLGRNEIFHYFQHNLKKLSREEAEERINQILTAIIKSGKFLEQNSF